MMDIRFTARQMSLTPEIKEYCQERIEALESLLRSVIEVNIILSVEKNRHKAEINVKAKGHSIFVSEVSHEMLNSLNLAFDSLERKMKKERERIRERKRRSTRDKRAFFPAREAEEGQKRIIKSDDYSSKPMPLEEALLQFELSKKEVFLFRKKGSEKWSVLFQRKDGNYGLIEPE